MTSTSKQTGRTYRTFLLMVFYVTLILYQLLGRPIDLDNLYSIQTIIIAVSLISLSLAIIHLVTVEREIILNRQLCLFALLYLLAIISVLWARSAVTVIQHLKFTTLYWVAFAVLVSTIRDKKQVKYWVGFLVGLAFLSIVILTTIALLYSSSENLSTSFFRSFDFDTNINIHSITLLTTYPVIIHYFYHSTNRTKRAFSIFIIFTGLVIIGLSGSRSPILVGGFWLLGLAVVNHEQAGWNRSQSLATIVLFFSLLAAFVFLIADPSIFGRLVSRTEVELNYLLQGNVSKPGPLRSRIYLTVWLIITEPHYLINGVGFHNFGVVFSDYTGHNYQPHPHNPIFKYLTEMGVIGMVCVIAILILPLTWLRNGLYHIDNYIFKSEFIAVGWSYVLLLSFGIFQPLFTRHHLYIISALMFSMYQMSKSERVKPTAESE